MSKLRLTCTCGQEMLVPESALGRTGLCPECGLEIAISEANTCSDQLPAAQKPGGGLLRRRYAVESNTENREESWRKFAAAVDLYQARRYAEALTLLNGLQSTFPGNPHVETAREQCFQALQDSISETVEYDGRLVQTDYISEDLVKSVVLDKMINGGTEEVKLQAAEMAARLLGLFERSTAAPEENELPYAPDSESETGATEHDSPLANEPDPAPESGPSAEELAAFAERFFSNGNGAPHDETPAIILTSDWTWRRRKTAQSEDGTRDMNGVREDA